MGGKQKRAVIPESSVPVKNNNSPVGGVYIEGSTLNINV